jgi:xanthine dehydrogenase accessory factor
MASGIAHRLFQSHLRVAMTERPEPRAVRRAVSFCEAAWEGVFEVEGVRSRRVEDPGRFDAVIDSGEIPVLVDPGLSCLGAWRPHVLCDATMAKKTRETGRPAAEWVIGLGPGFEVGVNADLVVETNRGHDLGRLLLRGTAEPHTGVPAPVDGHTTERVLRAPCGGVFEALADIGEVVEPGQVVARVAGQEVPATSIPEGTGGCATPFPTRLGL